MSTCRLNANFYPEVGETGVGEQDLTLSLAPQVSERQSALDRLEKCAEVKEAVEAELYGKFKLILNEKKAKIRRLMEQLSSLSDRNRALEGVVATTVGKPMEGDTPGIRSGDDTDDEVITGDSPGPKTPPTRPVESLLGGASEVVSPPVKRRRRQGTTKPTGQPEIPR